jgi:hypothetical protein
VISFALAWFVNFDSPDLVMTLVGGSPYYS